jgi:hypothetical protein
MEIGGAIISRIAPRRSSASVVFEFSLVPLMISPGSTMEFLIAILVMVLYNI